MLIEQQENNNKKDVIKPWFYSGLEKIKYRENKEKVIENEIKKELLNKRKRKKQTIYS